MKPLFGGRVGALRFEVSMACGLLLGWTLIGRHLGISVGPVTAVIWTEERARKPRPIEPELFARELASAIPHVRRSLDGEARGAEMPLYLRLQFDPDVLSEARRRVEGL